MGRRLLKAGWWLATPGRIRMRLQTRRQVLAGAVAPASEPAQVHDRFSLDQLPPLQSDGTAAVDWYDDEAPEVSIVVLNWNRSAMTLLCLDHLLHRTTGHRYEVIIVDNGSNPDQVELLRTRAGLARVVLLGTNRYFGEANNLGVQAARGRLICLLNNDAFVHEGWLEPLVAQLDRHPENGAIGPQMLYPDGRLQEAGALVNPDGSVVQLGKGKDPGDPVFALERQVDYVSAACALMRRDDFTRVLGFDLAWDPAYYEDVDLCLKLRLVGLRTIYCPQSCVTHFENATSADTSHELRLHNVVAINRTKFVARWGNFLQSGDRLPDLVPANPAEPAPEGTGKPRVVIYTPYNITPGGGERYLLTIAEALRDIAEVTLLTPGPFSRLRILTMGRDFCLQVDHIRMLTPETAVRDVAFDLAFVVGNQIFPSVGRLATRSIYICQFPFPIDDENFARVARQHWNEYDVVLTYSDFVRAHVLRLIKTLQLPHRPVEVLAPPVPLLPFAAGKSKTQIVHVGRFFTGGHCKRQDVLIEAVRQLVVGGLKVELHLAGSIHPEAEHRAYFADLIAKADGLPVHFYPNCSAAQLQQLYTESQIYWHATGFGEDVDLRPHLTEHFGISVVEAMSAGCIPIVFAAGGPVEVIEEGVTGFHFRTIEELCTRTKELVQNATPDTLEALARAAAAAARAYDEETFRSHVRTLALRFATPKADDYASRCA
jgi:O-antigen biosynthesis protein